MLLFGLSVPNSFDEDQAQKVRDLGVRIIRLDFGQWENNKERLERQVRTALNAGLSVYAHLTPNLVLDLPGSDPDGNYHARQQYWHANYTDSGNAYAWNFVNTARNIAQYFKDKNLRIDYFEIWNEPNAAPRPATPTNADWAGACGGSNGYDYGCDYGQGETALCPKQLGVLTTNAFMAIKEVNPSAKVVAGSLLTHGDNAWVAKEYWKQVVQSPAVTWHKNTKGRLPWDVVSIHPYDFPLFEPNSQIVPFKEILDSFQDPATIGVSEVGWSTMQGEPRCVSEPNQAKNLKDTFNAARNIPRSNQPPLELEFLLWFNYQDTANLHTGLKKPNNSWKPSATAYCSVSGAQNCPTIGSGENGSVDPTIVECHRRNKGTPEAGLPFSNGGGDMVHRWGAGQVQDFNGGSLGPNICMHRDGQLVAWMVRGAIRTTYLVDNGGGPGRLGYPVEDEGSTPIGPYQSFQYGYITWDSVSRSFKAYPYKGIDASYVRPVFDASSTTRIRMRQVLYSGNQFWLRDSTDSAGNQWPNAWASSTYNAAWGTQPNHPPTDKLDAADVYSVYDESGRQTGMRQVFFAGNTFWSRDSVDAVGSQWATSWTPATYDAAWGSHTNHPPIS